MADIKKSAKNKKPAASPWWNATVDIDTLDDDQRLAHEIVNRRRDLTPSVERIMSANLDRAVRGRALAAFDIALSVPGDPNRDPSVALANAAR